MATSPCVVVLSDATFRLEQQNDADAAWGLIDACEETELDLWGGEIDADSQGTAATTSTRVLGPEDLGSFFSCFFLAYLWLDGGSFAAEREEGVRRAELLTERIRWRIMQHAPPPVIGSQKSAASSSIPNNMDRVVERGVTALAARRRHDYPDYIARVLAFLSPLESHGGSASSSSTVDSAAPAAMLALAKRIHSLVSRRIEKRICLALADLYPNWERDIETSIVKEPTTPAQIRALLTVAKGRGLLQRGHVNGAQAGHGRSTSMNLPASAEASMAQLQKILSFVQANEPFLAASLLLEENITPPMH
ncbi:unnamed protein product [Amoebophrya sp. A25]|nr:unnamed protein product [Amoebophrya sp. A25]|eukprot:GSA25T00001085001.1